MLKLPKRVAFRKQAKLGQVKGMGSSSLQFGDVGRMACEVGRVTARQLEAARRVIRHRMARQGTLWIRVFPHRPVTAKPTEVRMGGGSGSVKYWATMTKPGVVRFELRGVEPSVARLACQSGAKKLPIRTVLLSRDVVLQENHTSSPQS